MKYKIPNQRFNKFNYNMYNLHQNDQYKNHYFPYILIEYDPNLMTKNVTKMVLFFYMIVLLFD